MAGGDEQAQDATAQTLHYALGNLGGKQKSWMQSTDAPHTAVATEPLPISKRPRGRPPKQRPSAELESRVPVLARPSIEPHAERQFSSNSTSPQLANVVTHHKSASANSRPSAVAVLPSPTPSEEIADAAPAQSSSNIDFFARASANAADTSYLNAGQRAMPHFKRPVEENAQGADKRSRVERTRQQRPLPAAGTGTAPSPSMTRPEFPQRPYAPPSQQGHSPSLAQHPVRHISSPHMRQDRFPVQQASGTPPQAQAPCAPQQTIPFGKWYTQKDCLLKLDAFHASHHGIQSDHNSHIRLVVLRDAVKKRDWWYLTMHQHYCMLSLYKEAVPAEVSQHPNLSEAMRVMREVLGANELLLPGILQFFCNFPYSLWELLTRWPMMSQNLGRAFTSFVGRASNYDQLRLVCEARRFPPLAHELGVDLAIVSPAFQRLVFTALLRYIVRPIPGGERDHFEAQAVAILQQNQSDFYHRLSRYSNPSHPHMLQGAENDKSIFGSRLQQLVNEFQSLLLPQPNLFAIPSAAAAQQSHLHTAPQAQYLPPPHSVHPTGSGGMPPRYIGPVGPYPAQAAIQQSRGPVHTRQRPGQSHQVPQSQSMLQQQGSAQRPRLLPAPGMMLPQQRQSNPARFSLHQAHLRSPILQAKAAPSSLCHFLEGFIKMPARLTEGGRAIERWTFTLTRSDMESFNPPIRGRAGRPDILDVNEQSKTIRLRCVKWRDAELPKDHEWAVADTAWVPYSYFTLNGTSLQQRKKVHNGKDLPIDLTGLIKEGENVLEIAVMVLSDDTSYLTYLVAIETLGVRAHETIKQQCLEINRVPADRVIQDIRKKLFGTSDDDDIAIIESTLTINLFDPFSASKICDIPVRGKACLHNNCFELDTFLQTRPRKGDASVPDQWRCPICRADARPHQLLVDGFLEDVRKQLEAQGLLRTRAIIVQQDGSWKPKAEVRDPNGVSDDPPTPTHARPMPPAHAEVIDLSD
jgi:hypothetical protein